MLIVPPVLGLAAAHTTRWNGAFFVAVKSKRLVKY
jgi:hypothetical protein